MIRNNVKNKEKEIIEIREYQSFEAFFERLESENGGAEIREFTETEIFEQINMGDDFKDSYTNNKFIKQYTNENDENNRSNL